MLKFQRIHTELFRPND